MFRVDYDVKVCCLASRDVYKKQGDRKDLDWQFKYVPKFSDERTGVYLATQGLARALLIASRGTADVTDIVTDIDLAFGRESQNNMIKLQTQKIMAIRNHFVGNGIVDADNVYLTGHSLGGFYSLVAHYRLPNTVAYIFNPGFPSTSLLPKSLKLEIHKMLDAKFITNYIVAGDLIALPTQGLIGQEVILRPSPEPTSLRQAHSIDYLNSIIYCVPSISNTNPLFIPVEPFQDAKAFEERQPFESSSDTSAS